MPSVVRVTCDAHGDVRRRRTVRWVQTNAAVVPRAAPPPTCKHGTHPIEQDCRCRCSVPEVLKPGCPSTWPRAGMDRRARRKQGHGWSGSNRMVVTGAGSPFLRQLLLRQSSFQYDHPGGPDSTFDCKSARRRHESLASLLSRPCQGEQRSEVPCQRHSPLLSKTQQCHCRPFYCGVC